MSQGHNWSLIKNEFDLFLWQSTYYQSWTLPRSFSYKIRFSKNVWIASGVAISERIDPRHTRGERGDSGLSELVRQARICPAVAEKSGFKVYYITMIRTKWQPLGSQIGWQPGHILFNCDFSGQFSINMDPIHSKAWVFPFQICPWWPKSVQNSPRYQCAKVPPATFSHPNFPA